MINEYENKAGDTRPRTNGVPKTKKTGNPGSKKGKKETVTLKRFIVTVPGQRPRSVLAKSMADAEAQLECDKI